MQCRVRSSARLSTIRGRYSLMRPHMIGRRGMWGTCLRTGTRCCCMGVRKMRLGNDHPSPGWAKNDRPVNRSFFRRSLPLSFPSRFFASASLFAPLPLFLATSPFFYYTLCMDSFSSLSVVFSSLTVVANSFVMYVPLIFPNPGFGIQSTDGRCIHKPMKLLRV